MSVFPDGEFGKLAITHYKVLERFSYVTLVQCKLETGRTHQIRVHLKYIGHTLFNDERYGGEKILKGTTFTKYYSDKVYGGPRKSLKEAEQVKDTLIKLVDDSCRVNGKLSKATILKGQKLLEDY